MTCLQLAGLFLCLKAAWRRERWLESEVFIMKKVVANVVVVVVASLYLVAKSLVIAVRLINKELEPYIKPVSLLQMAAFISVSFVGFGLLGVLMACMK